ncbi:gamma-glutamyltransferase [Ottowia sp. VDI28]|uniref:gamma-glutamyltransferase n=1 Tax=Ottowia sp. VDI28 TaxID=3133968 RepID=UPI003C2F0319
MSSITPYPASFARGRRFAVAAGHPAAAEAASAVMREGGNVADAAVAASAMLAVALPHANSIGGDMLGLYRDAATGMIHGLDAAGVAPSGATPEAFPEGIPRRGARASVVPGIVSGWSLLHTRFGRMAWADVLSAAVSGAASGIPRASGMREFVVECRANLAADPGCRGLFMAGGGAEPMLYQPALGESLSRIARYGAGEFYDGQLADRFSDFVERAGGLITREDLRRYQARWTIPLEGHYRGHQVHVLPPSSFGLLLLMQLAGLETVPSSLPAPARLEAQLQAMRAAFVLGEGLVHDGKPSLSQTQLSPLLDAMRQAMREPLDTPQELPGGTACVVAGDADGNLAVLVQSVFRPFGAACLDAETGILMNNRMLGFSAVPGGPNCVAPGKRPRHTLCPVLVMRDGLPRWALASPGGLSQTATLAQVLSGLVDQGLTPAKAVAQPRWCLSREREVLIEQHYPCGIGTGETGGLKVRDDPYAFGSAKVVEWSLGGGLIAAADGRRNAKATAI